MARSMPRGTWWGLENAEHHNGYNIIMYRGRYPFGCRGDSRHKGYDARPRGSRRWGRFIANRSRNRFYSWGRCVVRFVRYDPGGYHTFVGLYFPHVNMSMDVGHLKRGSTVRAGKWLRRGDVIGLCGTKRDGLGARHVHIRVSRGNWKQWSIPPCRDVYPGILWRKVGL